LQLAAKSVLKQEHVDLELIIVDDGSAVSTREQFRLAAGLDNRVRVISLETNSGIAHALNSGLRESKGKFIARMDSDDICEPQRLRTQLKFLDCRPEVAVLGSAVTLIDDSGESYGVFKKPCHHSELFRRRYKETPFFHPSVTMRRVFLEELGGYSEKWRRCEDFDLWLRGFDRFIYANIDEPLLQYRYRFRASLDDSIEIQKCSFHHWVLNHDFKGLFVRSTFIWLSFFARKMGFQQKFTMSARATKEQIDS